MKQGLCPCTPLKGRLSLENPMLDGKNINMYSVSRPGAQPRTTEVTSYGESLCWARGLLPLLHHEGRTDMLYKHTGSAFFI